MLHRHENQSKFLGQQGWVEILMITLVSSPKQHLRKESATQCKCYECKMLLLSKYNLGNFIFNSLKNRQLEKEKKKSFFAFPILQQVTYIINDRGITKANEETSALAIFCQSILFTHGDCGLFRLPIANVQRLENILRYISNVKIQS